MQKQSCVSWPHNMWFDSNQSHPLLIFDIITAIQVTLNYTHFFTKCDKTWNCNVTFFQWAIELVFFRTFRPTFLELKQDRSGSCGSRITTEGGLIHVIRCQNASKNSKCNRLYIKFFCEILIARKNDTIIQPRGCKMLMKVGRVRGSGKPFVHFHTKWAKS